MMKLHCYDYKPVKENIESDSDSDEFLIEIKENVVEEGEDSEVVVAPKAKKRQLHTTAMILTQKKTTFENGSNDTIPESVSKLNKIVSYDDNDSDS